MSSGKEEEKIPEDAPEEEPDIEVEQEPKGETTRAPVDAEGYIESIPPQQLPSYSSSDDVAQDDVRTSTEESTSQVPKKWIYLLGCVCVFFVVVLVMQVVVLRTIIDDDDDNGSSDEKTDAPIAPSVDEETSVSPTSSPTFSFAFASIANNREAELLGRVSNCDDCHQVVALPFRFRWFGSRPTYEIVVYTDGFITPSEREIWTGARDPIPIGMAYYPRIAVAQEDLSSESGGKILTMIDRDDDKQRFIISWEGVRFHVSGGYINAQAILHSDGIVDLCWGEAETKRNSIAAGVEDGRAIVFPATGDPFDDNGVTREGEWPTGQCRRFNVGGDYETFAPSPSPVYQYEQYIEELIIENSPDSGIALSNPDSPQYAAWNWLLRNDYLLSEEFSEQKILETYALATFYYSTNGQRWRYSDWLEGQEPCNWFGISCSWNWWGGDSRITNLFMPNNNVGGMIPREISMLSSLNELSLEYNELRGSIPSEISLLSSLAFVELSGNNLNGTIPDGIWDGRNLTYLSLNNNELIGTIPSGIPPISNRIQWLGLGYNVLEGTIPSSISGFTNLIILDLQYNYLKGPIPTDLSVLSDLQYLNLSGNELSGTIPTQLGNLEMLYYLGLAFNNLGGDMPEELCHLDLDLDLDDDFHQSLPKISADCDEVSCPCCQECCYGDGYYQYCTSVTQAPTSMPTGTPTISPAPTITPSPTRTPVSFTRLENTPGAKRLNRLDNCDYCTTVVELPFAFYWFGRTPLRNITVATDGLIEIYWDDIYGSIQVAWSDLDTRYGGSVWTHESGDSFIISWENVAFYYNSETFINAQAILRPNGDVDICYGEAKVLGYSVRSALSQYSWYDKATEILAEGPLFDSKGYTSNGLWPYNTCQYFGFGLELTPKPSPAPTITPSPTISAAPTFLGFASIANDPNSERLMSRGDDDVKDVKLPFTFNWLGDIAVDRLLVSTNGQINIFNSTDTGCCAPHAISLDNVHAKARIAVAQADLKIDFYSRKTNIPSSYPWMAPSQTPHWRRLEEYEFEEEKEEEENYYADDAYYPDYGGIWTLHTGRSFIISWENLVFVGTSNPINAQATLYSNGAVDICWGIGETQGVFNIAAGLLDTRISPPVAFPATGFPFGDDGITVDGFWPTDQCRQFKF